MTSTKTNLSSPESILVLGAGELGYATLLALAAKIGALPPSTPKPSLTATLTASTLTSPSAVKAQILANLHTRNINTVPLDLAESVDTLATFFQPYSSVISCTGFGASPRTQLKLAHAVLQAGVRRYFPWQFGVDYDIIGAEAAGGLFAEQCEVRQVLRAAQHEKTTEWVIVSTGIFAEFLLAPEWGLLDVEEGIVRAFGEWDARFTVTATADVGAVTAEVVFAEPRVVNDVVFVAGSTPSYSEFALLLEQILGVKLRHELWSRDFLQQELDKDPENGLKKYRCIWGNGQGVAWDMASTFNVLRSIKTSTLEQSARAILLQVAREMESSSHS